MDDGIFLDTVIGLRARNWWLTAVRRCRVTGLTVLRRQAEKARKIHLHADHPYATSENRFARLRTGDDTIPKAFNSDWAWRPEIWRDPLPTACGSPVASHTVLSDGVTVFHDGSRSRITRRQLPNPHDRDRAAYGLRLEMLDFDGSYLSLAVNLPDAAIAGLKRRHILEVSTLVEMESPVAMFARLNIRHGPNTEQMVRRLPSDQRDGKTEFDLAYTALNEKRIEHAWIDLIFERPRINRITLRDLAFSRRPRAESWHRGCRGRFYRRSTSESFWTGSLHTSEMISRPVSACGARNRRC